MRWQDPDESWDDDKDSPDDFDEDFDEDFEDSDVEDPSDEDSGDDDSEVLPCPGCGFTVYEDSPWCPSCGQYVTFPSGAAGVWSGRPTWWILLGILGVIATLALTLAV